MTDKQKWTITIEGMTCEHCARSVDEAVKTLDEVTSCATSADQGTSHVTTTGDLNLERLATAVANAGFRVVHVVNERPADGSTRKGTDKLDQLIIGAGSAGFSAAIVAAERGLAVALVERGDLGGTCVNVGCVPSKAIIRAAEATHRGGTKRFKGVHLSRGSVDFQEVITHKRELVTELQRAKYWDVLSSYPSVKLLRGSAKFRSDGAVEVDGVVVEANKVLIATGASPAMPNIKGAEETRTLTSTELMELEQLPESLVVIGGGYVGLELGQAMSRFGTKVTVLTRGRLLSSEEPAISEELETYLREEGLDVRTNVHVVSVKGQPGAYKLEFERDGHRMTITGQHVMMATGRRPNTAGMGLEDAGIRLGRGGEVLVDACLETSLPGVYAAGDVIGDPSFVYVAAYAGKLAAENALDLSDRHYDVSVVPRVTFTDPGVASVGLTEAQARGLYPDVQVTTMPMSYVPRALAARDTRGMVKLVANQRTNKLLGAHFLAPEAGEMVQAAAMAIRFGIQVDQIAAMLHPYLTNSEALKLACQTFNKDITKLSCCAA